jgi:hypothetical protein
MLSGKCRSNARHRKSPPLEELLLWTPRPWKPQHVAAEIQETKATQM